MNIDRLLTDTLTERPLVLRLGGRTFALRQPSLGALLLAEGALTAAGWPLGGAEGLAVRAADFAQRQPRAVAEFIAYHIASRSETQTPTAIDGYAREFEESLQPSELAALLVMLLERDPVAELIVALGIGEDLKARGEALARRRVDDWQTFGGRSIYGAIIDPLAERYGWRLDYILWGISYANLRLLLADQPTSLYQSESERGDRITRADDPANEAYIDQLLSD